MDKTTKIIAELTLSVVGEGTSISKILKPAIEVIDKFPGIRVMHHPMGTIIESDTIDQIFEVTKLAQETIFNAGSKRVVTRLTIDDRRDKARVMEDKVDAISN